MPAINDLVKDIIPTMTRLSNEQVIKTLTASNKVITAEFIKFTLDKTDGTTPTIMTYSNSFKEETIAGIVYSPLSTYLNISQQQRDLEPTSYDLTVSLSGIQQDNVYAVLSDEYRIRGSHIVVYRGFYNEDYELIAYSKRYTGTVTGYALEEQLDGDEDTYVVTATCANYKYILENKISGRFTNPESWTKLGLSTDTSMNRVPTLSTQQFDFGKDKK